MSLGPGARHTNPCALYILVPMGSGCRMNTTWCLVLVQRPNGLLQRRQCLGQRRRIRQLLAVLGLAHNFLQEEFERLVQLCALGEPRHLKDTSTRHGVVRAALAPPQLGVVRPVVSGYVVDDSTLGPLRQIRPARRSAECEAHGPHGLREPTQKRVGHDRFPPNTRVLLSLILAEWADFPYPYG